MAKLSFREQVLRVREDAIVDAVNRLLADKGFDLMTVDEVAAELGVARGAGLLILEGSGSAIPPVPWDAAVLVAPASVPLEYLIGYLGPFRLLLSDLLVVTMATDPVAGHEHLSALRTHVRRFLDDSRQIDRKSVV